MMRMPTGMPPGAATIIVRFRVFVPMTGAVARSRADDQISGRKTVA
jgi:hypothetical protein